MKRLLLLLPFLLAATPVRAQVDPEVHKLCSKVNDYAGCVQTNSARNQLNRKVISIETKTWEEVYLVNDPDMAEWAINNPEEAAIMKEQWQYAESVKKSSSIDNTEDCALASRLWNHAENRCEPTEETGARIQANIQSSSRNLENSCPPGKRVFQKTALFGLIKGQKICLSDFEAEQLKQQQARMMMDNINDMNTQRKLDQIESNTRKPAYTIPRIINCSSNTFGNYMSTTCY